MKELTKNIDNGYSSHCCDVDDSNSHVSNLLCIPLFNVQKRQRYVEAKLRLNASLVV